ncbi:hypothetical protein TNCV_1353921 [Trichonephila clavipes]|nr:hypothetical protein TNCV_1353921 [Trichonephila clavipes]
MVRGGPIPQPTTSVDLWTISCGDTGKILFTNFSIHNTGEFKSRRTVDIQNIDPTIHRKRLEYSYNLDALRATISVDIEIVQ